MSELPMGTGLAGRYGGLPEELSIEKSAQIVIIPVPFDKTTTYQKGSDRGPEALVEASRNMELYDIETDTQVCERGIFTAKAVLSDSSEEMLKSTYSETKRYLSQDKFVVILGGEHSISSAPIRAHAERYPGLSVLQFDAHADLQEAYDGNPLSHASVMARVQDIKQVSNIVSVGIRSQDQRECARQKREDTFFAHQIAADPEWSEKALKRLKPDVYITFDLDAFDCSLMPSTGTPEPGGLGWWQALNFIKLVCEKRNVVGCDVVELCPSPHNKAPDFIAAKLVYKMLSYKFHNK